MTPLEHRMIKTNGVTLHAAVQGTGPLVLMLHGFPGLWYSWRHQLPAIAAAGYTAVALDSLGYGRSDHPADQSFYDSNKIQGYLEGIVDSFGVERAFVIGQDFGAQYMWNFAVRAPDRVHAIVAMVPYDCDLAGRAGAGSKKSSSSLKVEMSSADTPPSVRFAEWAKKQFNNMHYYSLPGEAEKELGSKPRLFLQKLLFALSGKGKLMSWTTAYAPGIGYTDVLPEAPPLPWDWLSTEDMDYFVNEFMRVGPELAFIGGLNSYRTADRNWEIGEKYADEDVKPPALFLCGAEDPVLKMISPDALKIQRRRVPNLREVLIPDAGHCVQQERPQQTTDAILEFLNKIRAENKITR